MSILSLKWFGGMIPRRGEQNLPPTHATEAENVNLYSGELRPLIKPALAHEFCMPDEDCWKEPLDGGTGYPPILPPCPIGGVEPRITDFIVPPVIELGVPATLEVIATGTAPLLYQWFDDNVIIPGAVDSTYTYTPVDLLPINFIAVVNAPCGRARSDVISVAPVEPGCEPYSCSAYEDYLIDNNISYTNTYQISVDPLPWPFATADDNGYRFFVNAVAGASLLTDYTGSPGSGNNTCNLSSSGVFAAANPPDFCGGPIIKVVNISDVAPVPTIMQPGPAAPGNNQDNWGNASLQAIVIGHNGTSQMYGNVLRNTGKTWRWDPRDGSTATQNDNGLIRVRIDNSGNDVTIGLLISNNRPDYDDISAEFTVLDCADKFNLLTAEIISGTPYVDQVPGVADAWEVVQDVTVSATYAGAGATISGQQSYGQRLDNNAPLVGLLAKDGALLAEPLAFYVCKLSFASFSMGLATVDTTQEAQLAFDRNFASYTPPPECN